MSGREQTRRELKRRALVDLERSRAALARHGKAAATELSPAAMVERSFKKHRFAWIAGAAVAGAVALRFVFPSAALKNERDIFAKSGTTGKLVRMLALPLIAVGKKAAFDFAAQYFKNHFKQPFQAPSSEQESI